MNTKYATRLALWSTHTHTAVRGRPSRAKRIRCKIMNAVTLARTKTSMRFNIHNSHHYILSALSHFIFFVARFFPSSLRRRRRRCFFYLFVNVLTLKPEAYIIGFPNYKAAFPLISNRTYCGEYIWETKPAKNIIRKEMH